MTPDPRAACARGCGSARLGLSQSTFDRPTLFANSRHPLHSEPGRVCQLLHNITIRHGVLFDRPECTKNTRFCLSLYTGWGYSAHMCNVKRSTRVPHTTQMRFLLALFNILISYSLCDMHVHGILVNFSTVICVCDTA